MTNDELQRKIKGRWVTIQKGKNLSESRKWKKGDDYRLLVGNRRRSRLKGYIKRSGGYSLSEIMRM